MSKSRRPSVQKYHDRVAHKYDSSYEDEYWQWHDQLTWDYIKPHLPTDLSRRLADLGCGTGKWAAKLAKSGYQVACVDISPQMLDQAREKLTAQGSAPRCEFLQADLCDMRAIPDDTFTCAVAMGDPIGCTDSPSKALKEIRRILTEGGLLIATFDNRLAAIDFYLQSGNPEELETFLRQGRTHWLTKDAAEQFPIHTYGPSELRKLLEISGFSIVDLVGKTVLPMRHHRQLLAESQQRRHFAQIEKSLCRDPAAMGRAAHLQVVARVTK